MLQSTTVVCIMHYSDIFFLFSLCWICPLSNLYKQKRKKEKVLSDIQEKNNLIRVWVRVLSISLFLTTTCYSVGLLTSACQSNLHRSPFKMPLITNVNKASKDWIVFLNDRTTQEICLEPNLPKDMDLFSEWLRVFRHSFSSSRQICLQLNSSPTSHAGSVTGSPYPSSALSPQ